MQVSACKNNAIGINMKNKTFIKFFAAAVLFALCYTGRAFAADSENVYGNSIENIDFSSLSGGRVTVRVKLKAPMVNPPAGFPEWALSDEVGAVSMKSDEWKKWKEQKKKEGPL